MSEAVEAFWIPGQAEGAIPNGTRIRKTGYEEGDATPIGSLGTVLSSLDAAEVSAEMGIDCTYFYFVAWDWLPAIPVGVMDWKIGRADAGV